MRPKPGSDSPTVATYHQSPMTVWPTTQCKTSGSQDDESRFINKVGGEKLRPRSAAALRAPTVNAVASPRTAISGIKASASQPMRE